MGKLIILLAAVLSATAATAADVDFSSVLIGPDGPFRECIKLEDGGKCIQMADLTLRRFCVTAASLPDKNASISEQVKHGTLARRISETDKPLSLTAEDVAFLKGQIAKLGYNTIAVSIASEMLDPASVK